MDLRRKSRYTIQYTGKIDSSKVISKDTVNTYSDITLAQRNARSLRLFLAKVAKDKVSKVSVRKIPQHATYHVNTHRWS